MIREVKWREDRDIIYDRADNICGAKVRWSVLWFGETSEECGGETYRSEGESLAKVSELVGCRDNWRLESGPLSNTWKKIRP